MTLTENPADFVSTCKVCERGQLVLKKVFRMSGPVVAIGFILLIPSVLGMIASGLLLLGVSTYTGTQNQQTSVSTQSPPDDFDTSFRRACIKKASNKISLWMNEGYCECALEAYKTTNSIDATRTECEAKLQNGIIGVVTPEVQNLYDILIEQDDPSSDADTSFIRGCIKRGDGESPLSGNTGVPAQQYCQCELNETESGKSLDDARQACGNTFFDVDVSVETQSIYHKLSQPDTSQNVSLPAQPEPPTDGLLLDFVHIAGTGFAITLGIASFVSGLLGWLLVMKKRVLQCSVCKATITAS